MGTQLLSVTEDIVASTCHIGYYDAGSALRSNPGADNNRSSQNREGEVEQWTFGMHRTCLILTIDTDKHS